MVYDSQNSKKKHAQNKNEQVNEDWMQYESPLPVGTFVFKATKFIGLSTNASDMHYLLIVIYPPM